MNSLSFVRDGKALIARIEKVAAMSPSTDKDSSARQIQSEIDYLMNNMTNPSLPTAANLVEAAKKNKYTVDPKAIHKISQFI